MTSKVFVAVRVPASPERAFEIFTRDIGEWWQPSGLFRLASHGDGRLEFEPGPGGCLFTTWASGRRYEIGRILVWEPGARLVFEWRQPSFEPGQSTEVEVRFEPVGDATRVSVEHRAWDTIPREHVSRHGFPEHATLARVADWWRASLARYLAAAGGL